MEKSSVERRLNAIARHLFLPLNPRSPLLHQNPSSSSQSSVGPPVVIGGMVLDILAYPSTSPRPGTTTPGTVSYESGGVARNIVECMSKLGTKPFLISVVGIDMAGELLLKYWRAAKLSTEGILQLQNVTTPVVSNIFDSTGELAAAVASVDAVEKFISPAVVKKFQHYLCAAPLLILDANLDPQTIEVACQIAGEANIPVWFEPVSVTKSRRIASVVHYVTCASPNKEELVAMADALSPATVTENKNISFEVARDQGDYVEHLFQTLKPAIAILLDKGVKLLVVTLGADGVFLCVKEWPTFRTYCYSGITMANFSKQLHELRKESCLEKQFRTMNLGQSSFKFIAFHFPAPKAEVVSLTGAGDCLVAGILASVCCGLDLMQSVAVGMAVAKAAVESKANVPSDFSSTDISGEATRILSGAKQLPV